MSNKYVLKLSRQAVRDIDVIFQYISNDLSNDLAAAKLIDEIIGTLISLETMPFRCPLSEIPELQRRGYRKCVVRNYISLYTIDEELMIIKIVRVIYGKREYGEILDK